MAAQVRRRGGAPAAGGGTAAGRAARQCQGQVRLVGLPRCDSLRGWEPASPKSWKQVNRTAASDLICVRLLTSVRCWSLRRRDGLRAVASNLNVRHRNAQMAGRASVELHTLIFFKGRTVVADARVTKVRRCACVGGEGRGPLPAWSCARSSSSRGARWWPTHASQRCAAVRVWEGRGGAHCQRGAAHAHLLQGAHGGGRRTRHKGAPLCVCGRGGEGPIASVELRTLIFFKGRTVVADARVTKVRRCAYAACMWDLHLFGHVGRAVVCVCVEGAGGQGDAAAARRSGAHHATAAGNCVLE